MFVGGIPELVHTRRRRDSASSRFRVVAIPYNTPRSIIVSNISCIVVSTLNIVVNKGENIAAYIALNI